MYQSQAARKAVRPGVNAARDSRAAVDTAGYTKGLNLKVDTASGFQTGSGLCSAVAVGPGVTTRTGSWPDPPRKIERTL